MAEEKKKTVLGKRKIRTYDPYPIERISQVATPQQAIIWQYPQEVMRRLQALVGVIVLVQGANVKKPSKYFIEGFQIKILPNTRQTGLSTSFFAHPSLQIHLRAPNDGKFLRLLHTKKWTFGTDDFNVNLAQIIETMDVHKDQMISFLLGTRPNIGRNDQVWTRDTSASSTTTRVEHLVNRGPQSSIHRAWTSALGERALFALVAKFL